jgi:hypothetical protein
MALHAKVTLQNKSIESAEQLVDFQLDWKRNVLMTYDMVLSILSICFGFGGMIAGFFGMSSIFCETAVCVWEYNKPFVLV